jgi:hypothetical protein
MFWDALSLGIRCGSTITLQKADAIISSGIIYQKEQMSVLVLYIDWYTRNRMHNPIIKIIKKKFKTHTLLVRVLTLRGWESVNANLGCTRTRFGILLREEYNNVYYSEMLQDQLKTVIQIKQWGLLPCFMVMPVHTMLPGPLKFAVNWILKCWSIFHVFLIWLFLTITYFVHSEMRWKATILVIKKWKK